MSLDPRIGTLNSGKFYCFPNGNGKPELIGSLEEVEVALGLRLLPAAPTAPEIPMNRLWDVWLTFQYPAWDEVNGIVFTDILASTKSNANAIARRRADCDGHLGGRKGRATFTATEQ